MAESFSIPANFAGVELWDPTKGGITDPAPGAYVAKTVGAELHTKIKDGAESKSIKVSVELAGGEQTDLYLGLDFSKAGNVRKLATALASVGIDMAKLAKAGPVNVVPAFFMGPDGKGRPCHVIVKAVEGVDAIGRKRLNDKEFATKDQYAAYMAAMAAGSGAAASNGAAPGGHIPAAASGTPDDLKALFGAGA